MSSLIITYIFCPHQTIILYTAEPLNKGHIGTSHFVHYYTLPRGYKMDDSVTFVPYQKMYLNPTYQHTRQNRQNDQKLTPPKLAQAIYLP